MIRRLVGIAGIGRDHIIFVRCFSRVHDAINSHFAEFRIGPIEAEFSRLIHRISGGEQALRIATGRPARLTCHGRQSRPPESPGRIPTCSGQSLNMNSLPHSAEKVARALRAASLDTSIVQMPTQTRTAEEAAAACQCLTSQIVKSLVFQGKTTQSPYLLLVSGTNRVDPKVAAAATGEKLDRPDANYVREITGFAIGGIPPLGHATPLKTYFDADLLQHEWIWAAAGTPNCVFRANPKALCDAVKAEIIHVC